MIKLKLWRVFLLELVFSSVTCQWDPHFTPGRTTIVHLFEWKWSNIAAECERFLGPQGFGGVQTSPVSENARIMSPFRPWYERYQPISYKLNTRSGNEVQFGDMVRRCNAVGVRIYPDLIINHMSSMTDLNGAEYSYPGVPYKSKHFNKYPTECTNPSGQIGNYNNSEQVRNCELLTLRDLKLGDPYVRAKIVDYLNKLVAHGVAGFRVDAAKHMWPEDMIAIFNSLTDLNTSHGFRAGTRAFLFQEVSDLGNEAIRGSDYFQLGRVTEFKYGAELGRVFRGLDKLKWLINWGEDWGMFPPGKALIFMDNHDNQRGHGVGDQNILTFRDGRIYRMATAFKLAHPYGLVRIMSSYGWEPYQHNWIGPPSNKNEEIDNVTINEDLSCGGGWICEHRWRQIRNMVQFRNVVDGAGINDWWDNDNNQIAFCRGNRGFIAINNDNLPMNVKLKTCLPPGIYCDIISGEKVGESCTGKTIVVGQDGRANIAISNTDTDLVIAITIEVIIFNPEKFTEFQMNLNELNIRRVIP